MIALAISIWQGILGGTIGAGVGGGTNNAGEPIGLLLILTKAS